MLNVKTPVSYFALFALVLLAAAAMLIAPNAVTPDLEAIESEDCFCDLGERTQTRWGIGSSCAASLADLDAQASADYQNEAPSVCPAPCGGGPGEGCSAKLVITGSCTWDSLHQQYVTDGHYSYGCFVCP